MPTKNYKTLLVIVGLIALTCAAMAYSNRSESATVPVQPVKTVKGEILSLSAKLTQDKILQNSDGNAALALTLSAADIPSDQGSVSPKVDMAIVLDRSGSMNGQKLDYARRAISQLLSQLGPEDRFALVTYDDQVVVNSSLVQVTADARERLYSTIQAVASGGSTNLGAGLSTGIQIIRNNRRSDHVAKVILISDGLANVGVTDPAALGNMASIAPENTFSISTVGVGNDFNEHLMTNLADRGSGVYYYLENPEAFAQVFEKEFRATRTLAAGGITVEVPLPKGVSLVHAGGYPIEMKADRAVFPAGDLTSGRQRTLFLQFKVPAAELQAFEIGKIRVDYRHGDRAYSTTLPESFSIACIADPKAVLASIDKKEWSRKVLQEDYNRLKEGVSMDIKNGRENEAMGKIEQYYKAQGTVNAAVQSQEVDQNLKKDLAELRSTVKDTFAGAPAAVAEKQKKNAKTMQFESYQGRRAN